MDGKSFSSYRRMTESATSSQEIPPQRKELLCTTRAKNKITRTTNKWRKIEYSKRVEHADSAWRPSTNLDHPDPTYRPIVG